MHPESVIINIDRYGNTTAATIPLAMETAREEGKLKKGDLVLLASVGAGFTVAASCCAGRTDVDSAASAAFVRSSIALISFASSASSWCEFDNGMCETTLIPSERHLQQHGLIHAGVLATMADHTAGGAAGSILGGTRRRPEH